MDDWKECSSEFEGKTHLTHDCACVMGVIMAACGLFFDAKEAGKSLGLVTPSGGGIWGFLNSLANEGPQTVPDLARRRPVSRQHIQSIANEAAAQGLVEFQDNPRHKRSRLVALTAKGRETHARMTQNFAAAAATLAKGLDTAELETTARVLDALRRRMGDVVEE